MTPRPACTIARPARIGRWLLTVVLVATIATEIAFTWLGWTGQHVFNPEWHPHARFHVVQESLLITAICLAGLVWVWRRPEHLRPAVVAVVFVQLVYQGAEFVALLVPGRAPRLCSAGRTTSTCSASRSPAVSCSRPWPSS